MVIVYTSNTGFTKEYAEMLGRAEKMKVYELSQAESQLEPKAEVLYLGPLMAGHVSGIDQAMRRYAVQAVCGVGIAVPGERVMADMRRANYVSGAPLFYLHGGWAPKQVSWLKRRMVGMATRSVRQTLQAKGSRRSPKEQAYLDALLRGGSFVAFENLDEIRNWIKEQKR